MEDSPGVAKQLLRWCTTFDFGRSVTSYRDLQDGRILWKILKETDPEYFDGELPEPNASSADNWIQRWQNLKHIEKLVTTFIRDEREKLPEVSRRMSPDLKAAAIDASNEDSVQLLKLVFLAAVYSPHSNQRTVQKLSSLGPAASSEIASWIQKLEMQDQQLVDGSSQGHGSDAGGMLSPNRGPHSPEPDVSRDRDLMWEERLISANSTINNQQNKIENQSRLMEQRQKEYLGLEEELNELRARVEHGGMSAASNEAVEQLRKKVAEDRDYIDEIESENHTLREKTEEMDSKLARYKTDVDQKTKLRDELQMTKVERDDYMQKAKAADNLRKKIQTLQESDKSNASLRADLEAAQEELRGLQRFKDKCAALQKANEENMKTIANGEQEIFDMKTTRRRIDQDLKYYAQRHEASKERLAQNSDTIAELEEKVRELEAGHGGTTPSLGNLDDEFSSSDKTHAELQTKLAELETENKQLKQAARDKTTVDTDAEFPSDDSASKHALQLLQQRFHSIEKQYLEVFQENIGLDSTIKGVEQSVTESRPFIELRDRLHDITNKLDLSDKRLFEAESDLADKKLALEAADGRLTALGEDRAAAAEEVRKSAGAHEDISKKEIERLRNRVEALQFQSDEKSSLLRHALSDQGQLLKDDEELRSANETRLVQEQLTQHKEKDEPSEEELVLSLAKRIETGRTKLKEVTDKANQERNDFTAQLETLQMRLKRAEEIARRKGKSDDGDGRVAENVQRELALMTSAWYDLTGRLQSDAVIVQRRAEGMPRSFLGRQRRRVLG